MSREVQMEMIKGHFHSFLFSLTLTLSRQSGFTSFHISVHKRIIYCTIPERYSLNYRKWQKETANHCWFTLGIHENNASSGTKASQLKTFLLSSVFIVGVQSEYRMTRQSHIKVFNHAVMKGNLGHDSLLRGLKQQERSCKGHLGPGLY